MSKISFALLCGFIASSPFWITSLYSNQIGWKAVAIEHFIFATVITLFVNIYVYGQLIKQDQRL